VGEISSTVLQSRDHEREKSLQKSPDSEWEKSHSGVSWMPEGESVFSPPSRELSSQRTSRWTCKKSGLKWGCYPTTDWMRPF